MGEAAGAAAAVMGSRCSWELRRRGVGGGMQSGPCPGCRAAIGIGSRGGNCGHDRLGRLPGKMAVGLTAPLSLLRRSGLPGEDGGSRPPNSAACPRRGPAPLRALQKVEAGAGGGGRCGGAARSPPTPCPAASPPRASPRRVPPALVRRRRPPPLPPG